MQSGAKVYLFLGEGECQFAELPDYAAAVGFVRESIPNAEWKDWVVPVGGGGAWRSASDVVMHLEALVVLVGVYPFGSSRS